ncbi:hypothetical protein V6N11_077631 [Hibiscus sabdariffa]|uniref:Uncharacterized protein n=1 Tax=Hibiscus sabdariffa TaxID=183260 RepID=A0ABR2TDL3_9ROSI
MNWASASPNSGSLVSNEDGPNNGIKLQHFIPGPTGHSQTPDSSKCHSDKSCTVKAKPTIKSAQVWKLKKVIASAAKPSHGSDADVVALHASKYVELELLEIRMLNLLVMSILLTTSVQIIGEQHDQLVDDELSFADVEFPTLHNSVKKKGKGRGKGEKNKLDPSSYKLDTLMEGYAAPGEVGRQPRTDAQGVVNLM